MLGTKVEITLPKAEPGHWSTLFIANKAAEVNKNDKIESKTNEPATNNDSSDSDLDLDEIEQVRGVKITDA